MNNQDDSNDINFKTPEKDDKKESFNDPIEESTQKAMQNFIMQSSEAKSDISSTE